MPPCMLWTQPSLKLHISGFTPSPPPLSSSTPLSAQNTGMWLLSASTGGFIGLEMIHGTSLTQPILLRGTQTRPPFPSALAPTHLSRWQRVDRLVLSRHGYKTAHGVRRQAFYFEKVSEHLPSVLPLRWLDSWGMESCEMCRVRTKRIFKRKNNNTPFS